MHSHFNRSQNILISLSLITGIILGIIGSVTINATASYFIDIFMNLLKFISLPLIFFSITSAVAKLQDQSHFKSIMGRALKYTLLTTIAASCLSMIIYKIIDPAKRSALEAISSTIGGNDNNIWQHLINIVPSNIVKIFHDHNVMAVVSAALMIGIASLFLESEQKRTVHKAFEGFFSIFMKIASFIIMLIPFVLWAFIVMFIRDIQSGFDITKLVYYIIAISLANALQAIVVLPIFLKSKGISPINTFRGMLPALVTGFFSKSSSASMPATMHCIEKNLQVSPKISSVTIPLCTTINMNACAAFIYITVLFVAESNGVSFSSFDYVMWIFLATIAAVGNAGVPMGCFFMASAYLANMGVSTYLMGVILPFYAILDMFETAINIWSDACVTIVINKGYVQDAEKQQRASRN